MVISDNFINRHLQLNNKNVKFINSRFEKIVQRDYRLYHVGKNDIQMIDEEFTHNIKESSFAIIKYICSDSDYKFYRFIIGFEKSIIIIKNKIVLAHFFDSILTINSNLSLLFLPGTKEIFNQYVKIEYNELKYNENLLEEIAMFKYLYIFTHEYSSFKIVEIYKCIITCIAGYLIQKSYLKTEINRIKKIYFNTDKAIKGKIISKDEYVELRTLGCGSIFFTRLIYHFDLEELLVIKKPNVKDCEIKKLKEREKNNYLQLNHPLMPKFIGETEEGYLIIEYINGRALDVYDKTQLSIEDKFQIIFELILTIEYLHRNHSIYRDLKPTNIMIDKNKTAVLIDFDRMIKEEKLINEDQTLDFCSNYASPEINTNNLSYSCDIYSLGKIIEYLIDEKSYLIKNESSDYKLIEKIYKSCINENPSKRPSIYDMFYDFYVLFYFKMPQLIDYYDSEINNLIDNNAYILNQLGLFYYNEHDINKSIKYLSLSANKNHPQAQFSLGLIYYLGQYISRDISKAIHYYTLAANNNDANAQINLGSFYLKGIYVKRDINKAIYYYSLASNQNHSKAQLNLGILYEKGDFISKDINKAIYYYSLAANQNEKNAQYNLAKMYYEGKYISRDITKSIHYFSLAADQNHSNAQFYLGLIYYEGKYISKDIKKAIYYLSLAANQNNPSSQLILGLIYSNGVYVKRDIQKAIHYLTLSSNQNDMIAQFKLGEIYYESEYTSRDINKSIYYYSLAANQNYSEAQYNLGVIYEEGQFISRDIKKAIYYYSLAANNNHPDAQFNLGVFYYVGQYISRDMKKSIYYFSLAANQNHPEAQYNLGVIYYDGEYIPRNINRSIHYFTLSANQNHYLAQYNLGVIYSHGKYVAIDIYKSIYYLNLAASQNYSQAQFNLGLIYYEGQHISRDINKSIYYFEKSANQNYDKAQLSLGVIYYKGKYIKKDFCKAFHYFNLAANQNNSQAQFYLALIYYNGEKNYFGGKKTINFNDKFQSSLEIDCDKKIFIQQDINKAFHYLTLAANQNYQPAQYFLGLFYLKTNSFQYMIKGIDYLMQSSKNGNIDACFAVGYFYHEGKYVENDIRKAIHYYKKASSFNNQYAKNNLGIIYKNGIGNEVTTNLGISIEYLSEAIRQKNDHVSMYNLAHIYIFEFESEDRIEESIKLLIDSSNKGFLPSNVLLCIALIKKYKFDFSKINQELENVNNLSKEFFTLIYLLKNIKFFDEVYQHYKTKDFIYDFQMQPVLTQNFVLKEQRKENMNDNIHDVSSDFYYGFGIDL